VAWPKKQYTAAATTATRDFLRKDKR